MSEATEMLVNAAAAVLFQVRNKASGSGVLIKKHRHTWNPNAHIELTMSAAELWAIQDAIAEVRKNEKSV